MEEKNPVDAVAKILEGVGLPLSWCTSHECSVFPPPCLVVDGVGDVPFPIPKQTVAKLRTHKNTSQGARLTNPAWNKFVVSIFDAECRRRLGFPEGMDLRVSVQRVKLGFTCDGMPYLASTVPSTRRAATLLVMLPHPLDGGEVTVAGQSNRSPREELQVEVQSPHSVRFIAFHGECTYRSGAIRVGCLVWLVYDVILSAPFVPDLNLDRGWLDRIEHQIEVFFAQSPSDKNHLATSRKLIYVLEDSYQQNKLAIDDLRECDQSVVRYFTELCKTGAYKMFLTQATYTQIRPRDLRRQSTAPYPTAEHQMILRDPLEEDSTHGDPSRLVLEHSVECEIAKEVVPQSRLVDVWFDDSRLEMTGDDAMKVCTKKFAVLVLIPSSDFFRSRFRDDPQTALEKWIDLAVQDRARACCAAAAFAEAPQRWPLHAALGERIIDTVCTLGDAKVFRDIVVSCAGVQFQPRLRGILDRFGTNVVVDTLQQISFKRLGVANMVTRDLVNLVALILHGISDTAPITAVLEAVPVYPLGGHHLAEDSPDAFTIIRDEFDESDIRPSEFARVLGLAASVSADLLRACLSTTDVATRVVVIGPALVQYLEHASASSSLGSGPIRAVVKQWSETLRDYLPVIKKAGRAVGSLSEPSERVLESALLYKAQEIVTALETFLIDDPTRSDPVNATPRVATTSNASTSVDASTQVDHDLDDPGTDGPIKDTTRPHVDVFYWVHKLQCPIMRIKNSDGCGLYRAYQATQLNNLTMEVEEAKVANVAGTVAGFLRNQANAVLIHEIAATRLDHLSGLLDDSGRVNAVPFSNGYPSLELTALAIHAKQPVYVIVVATDGRTRVQRHSCDATRLLKSVARLADDDAARVFAAYIDKYVWPVVLVWYDASRSFDAIPVRGVYFTRWRLKCSGNIVRDLPKRMRAAHTKVGLTADGDSNEATDA